jgi:hypothetical protein
MAASRCPANVPQVAITVPSGTHAAAPLSPVFLANNSLVVGDIANRVAYQFPALKGQRVPTVTIRGPFIAPGSIAAGP